jgi:hypothetical protein
MKQVAITLASVFVLSMWAIAADDKKKDAANTDKNERGRDPQTITPGDQSETPEDRKLTQSIRQSVMKGKSLSLKAENISTTSQSSTPDAGKFTDRPAQPTMAT